MVRRDGSHVWVEQSFTIQNNPDGMVWKTFDIEASDKAKEYIII